MEQNTDRMGFALIALSIVAVVLIIMNTIFGPTVKSYFQGLQKWSNNIMTQLNPPQQYTHTAYAYSADGTDGFTTVYPNLNLLKNTRTLTATSNASWWNTLFSSEQIYDSAIKSKTGVSVMNFSFSVYVPLNAIVGSAISIQLKGQSSQAYGHIETNEYNTIVGQYWHDIEQSDLGKTIRVSFPIQIDTKYKTFDSALADTDSITIRQIKDTSGLVYSKLKLEQGSTATPHMPSQSEATAADQPKYIGTYVDKNESTSQDPTKYTWKVNPDYHE